MAHKEIREVGEYDFSILLCPICSSKELYNRKCNACGYNFNTFKGNLDLRADPSFDTLLDIESYDKGHGANIPPSPALAELFFELLSQGGIVPRGKILEIACGSGQLTGSLALSDRFDEIHSGDISADFMELLRARLSNITSQSKIYTYLYDANKLPFQDKTFDFVIGNSVLHHFSHFERTIEDVHRVLRPGGAALFGEPILDTHALVSLAAGLISRAVEQGFSPSMDKKTLQVLTVIRGRTAIKLSNLFSDRQKLDHIEDKFQFPIAYLQKLAKDIGFDDLIFSSVPSNLRIGDEARKGIERTFTQMGIDRSCLSEFQFVFDAMSNDYGTPMAPFIQPLFSRFALVKY